MRSVSHPVFVNYHTAQLWFGLGLELGLFHTDASTLSDHSQQTTSAYIYHSHWCEREHSRKSLAWMFVYTRAVNEVLAHSRE